MRIVAKIFLLVLGLSFFASCNQKTLFDQEATIENGKWFKDNPVHFEVDVTDTTRLYDYYLTIRHNTDYRYSNIYFFLTTKFPNDNVTRDTLECILAKNSGRWLGKGWGDIKEDNILLRKNLKFPLKGKYDFYFQQAMRRDTLSDILNLGIRLIESQ